MLEDMERTTLTDRRAWLTDSVLLAVIPAMAYVLAFAFEYGYYFAYGFPQELISIDLNRVFVAGVIFLGGVLLLLVPATAVLAVLPSEHPLTPAIAQAATFVLAYLVFLVYYWRFDMVAWFLGLLLLWHLGYKFGLPLLTQRGVHGFIQKFRRHAQRQQERTTVFRMALRMLGPTQGAIVVYFFVALVLAVSFGWSLAREQVYYFVVPGQPERVVLRIYGDSIILAPFDRHTRQILPEYTVLRRTIGAITLREERIGPLTVAR